MTQAQQAEAIRLLTWARGTVSAYTVALLPEAWIQWLEDTTALLQAILEHERKSDR